jgi:hypothetical protein
MAEFINMELKGTAVDAHQNFPIKFDYSENGNAYLIGCKVEAQIETSNGGTITKRMDIRAFGEEAEALAHITNGHQIHVKASYDMQKSKNDQWFPVATVREVIEA